MTGQDNAISHQGDEILQLSDCNVFILDLDGTLYEETGHFAFYGQQIAGKLPEQVRGAYLKDVNDALSGKHTLSYGDGYDVKNRAIVRDGKLLDWSGARLEMDPSDWVEFIDDPWNVYGNTAAYYGASLDDIQTSFLETRRYMESADFPMHGMNGLRRSIDQLRSFGVRFALLTNSPEPDSRTILEKIGLTGAFDREVFNAKKQLHAPEHFRRFQDLFGVPFSHMASVGDHYRNEIRPAAALGMKTICIDRYVTRVREDVTVTVHHPGDLAQVFEAVAQARS